MSSTAIWPLYAGWAFDLANQMWLQKLKSGMKHVFSVSVFLQLWLNTTTSEIFHVIFF